MAKTMLERMRERMAERKPTFEQDLSIYPFWNMDYNQSSVVRLLPYEDSLTGAFWAEKVMLPMVFTDPENESEVVYFQAPCREMYDPSNKCPVAKIVTELYAEAKELRITGNTRDADRLEKVANSHWKKRVFYYQGFVEKAGLTEKETPENPIRVFPLTKKIHEKIYNSVFHNEEDPFESLPTGEFTMDDIKAIVEDRADDDVLEKLEGNNFILKKLKQGEFADWSTGSTWTKSRTPLSAEQIEALYHNGMHDLTKRLPERPTDEQYAVLVEMMEGSVSRIRDGELVVWSPEWTKAGFNFFRKKKSGKISGGTDNTTDSSAEGNKKFSSNTRKAAGSNSDALAKLRAGKGVSSSNEETSEPEDSNTKFEASDAESTSEPEPSSTKTSNVNDVAARIRARAAAKASQ